MVLKVTPSKEALLGAATTLSEPPLFSALCHKERKTALAHKGPIPRGSLRVSDCLQGGTLSFVPSSNLENSKGPG
jgi:hypothetical protein